MHEPNQHSKFFPLEFYKHHLVEQEGRLTTYSNLCLYFSLMNHLHI